MSLWVDYSSGGGPPFGSLPLPKVRAAKLPSDLSSGLEYCIQPSLFVHRGSVVASSIFTRWPARQQMAVLLREFQSRNCTASINRVADEDLTAWSARVTMPPNKLNYEQE
jgi:hypothetical protein